MFNYDVVAERLRNGLQHRLYGFNSRPRLLGAVAEWLRNRLQNGVHGFDSHPRLLSKK
jgi:hypothetical protein